MRYFVILLALLSANAHADDEVRIDEIVRRLQMLATDLDGLRGLQDVSILVEDLDDDAKQCGITESALDAAVRLPVSASRLKIAKDFGEGTDRSYVYVVVITVRPADICIASVSVSLRRTVLLQTPPESRFQGASTWEKSSVMTGPAYSFGKRVSDNVEGFTKELIAAWLKQNAE
jgi:hypothetical protein